MPTTAIPQTDPALLQAQATAGQAGVLAYEAAKKEMAAARQQAVGDAMTAAQNRGAPQGAMESALGGANQMYDRRDAALITAGASQEADLANRASRMADYQGAVGMARGLIGEQAAQAVAPIDARTRFAVGNIEAEGRANVDEIEARRRLKELEMEAAFLAAQGSGGGGGGGGGGRGGGGGGGKGGSKGTPNASELKSMLTQRAIPKVEAAFKAAAGSIAGNRAHGQSQVRQLTNVKNTVQKKQAAAVSKVQANTRRGPVSVRQAENAKPTSPFTILSGADKTGRKPTPFSVLGGGDKTGIPYKRPTSVLAPKPGTTTSTSRVIPAMRGSMRPTTTPILTNDAATRRRDIDKASRLQAGLRGNVRNMEGEIRDAWSQEHGAVRQGLMNLWDPEQNPGMADIYTPVFNNGIPMTERSLEEQMLGSANGPGASPEVIRQAMIQSAGELVDEGYKIDEPALSLALDYDAGYKLGSSYYDAFGRMAGLGDLDQQAAAERTLLNNERADTRWEREGLENNRQDLTFSQSQEDRERRIAAAEAALADARTTKERKDALALYEDELQGQGIVPQRLSGVDPDVQYGVAEGGDNFQSWNEGKALVEEFRDAINEDTGKPYEWDDVRRELVQRGGMAPAGNVNDQILLDLLEQYW